MKLRNTVLLAGAVAMAFSIPQAGLAAKAHWGKPVIQIYWGGGYNVGGWRVYPIRNNMERNIWRGILPNSAWNNKEDEKMTLSLIAQAYAPETVKAWDDAFMAREKIEKEITDEKRKLTKAQKRKIPKKTIDELEQEEVASLENRLNKSKLNAAVRKKDVPTIKTALASLLVAYTSETNTKFLQELNAIKAVQTSVPPAPCTPSTTQLNCTPPVTPTPVTPTPVTPTPVTPTPVTPTPVTPTPVTPTPVTPTPVTPTPVTPTPVTPTPVTPTPVTPTPTGSSASTTTVTGTPNSSSVIQTTGVTGDN